MNHTVTMAKSEEDQKIPAPGTTIEWRNSIYMVLNPDRLSDLWAKDYDFHAVALNAGSKDNSGTVRGFTLNSDWDNWIVRYDIELTQKESD